MAVVLLAGLRPIRIPGTITSSTPGEIYFSVGAFLGGGTCHDGCGYRCARGFVSHIAPVDKPSLQPGADVFIGDGLS